jgi:hypothetical protein
MTVALSVGSSTASAAALPNAMAVMTTALDAIDVTRDMNAL